MHEISFSNLFPSHFFTLTNEGFSGTIVLILGAIFVGFIIKTLLDFFIARKQITFYLHKFRQLKQLKQVESDKFITNWRAITNEVKQEQKYASLWNEFAESLVTAQRSSEAFPRLYNVVDAEHFFNKHTLAAKLTENRLLVSVPSILTAIGVLGTFIGLQFGLGDFTGLGDNPSVDELKKAVFGMIGGAGIAFMTSVWGVFFSLIFNATEKYLEQYVCKDIAELQNEIDYLFPRIVAEQVLSDIETHSAQSRNSLAELGEKIGDRMQEVMNGVSETISSEIARTLSEAMKELADKASTSSESALGTLIEQFIDKIGDAGDKQRSALENATISLEALHMNATSTQFNQLSENLKTAVNDLGDKLNKVMLKVEETTDRQSESVDLFKEVNTQFGTASQAVEKTAESLEKTAEEFKQFNQELAEHIGELNEQVKNFLNEYTEQVQAQTSDRLNQWNEQTNEYTATMMDAIEVLSEVVEEIDNKFGRR